MTVMDAVEIERCTRKKLPSSIKKISESKKSSSKSSGKSSARKKRVIGQGEAYSSEVSRDLSQQFPVIQENFDILSKVGEGTFSKVYLAQLRSYPDEIVAIKHIVPTSSPVRVRNELSCLQKLGGKHNIIGVKTTLRNNDHIAFILPYFKHDKFQTFFRRLNTSEIRDYMKNLFAALAHVHSYNIIHRDVKPSNFLHSRQTKRYSLVDFGLAMQVPGTHGILSEDNSPASANTRARTQAKVKLNAERSAQNEASKMAAKNSIARGDKYSAKNTRLRPESNLKTGVLCKIGHHPGHSHTSVCSFCCSRSGQNAPRAGTPGFRSPEILMKLPNQTTAVDIWSAGIILLSFLSGRYPFFKAKDDLSSLAQIITVFGSKEVASAGNLIGKDLTCSQTVPPFELKSLCERLRQKTCTCHRLTSTKRKYSSRDAVSKRPRIESFESNESEERINTSVSPNRNSADCRRETSTKIEPRRSPRKRQGLRGCDNLENTSTPMSNNRIQPLEDSPQYQRVSDTETRTRTFSYGDCYCIPDSAYDLLSKCLKLNPAQRITASDALNHRFLTS